MAERKLVLTRAEESLLDRLDDERNAIEKFMRHVRAAQRRRDLLIVKLRGAGVPARTIEPHAGVTNVTVLNIAKRWKGDSTRA